MPLDLFVSPPGTGKTTRCIDLFKKEILRSKAGIDSRSFFILPNREHAERVQNLLLKTDLPGLFNVHILTINEFTSRTLGPFAGVYPSESMRRSILRGLLESPDCPGLPYFDAVKNFKGFHEVLSDSIGEFKSSLLSMREFEKRAQPLLKDPAFRMKFKDFSIVLKQYEAKMKKMGLREPEEDFGELAASPENFRDMELVIFDGFHHFTRAQKRLLAAVAKGARHVVVTLTLPGDAERQGHFDHPAKTRQILLKTGFKERPGLFPVNHRTRDASLLHLERNLFLAKPVKAVSPGSIRIAETPDKRQEMQWVAREIRRLYRGDPDLAYSDICVIFRHIGAYEKVLASVFSDYGVPVHVHERKRLIEQGLVHTLCCFLDVLLEGWKRADVLHVLKSGYFCSTPQVEMLALEAVAVGERVLEGKEVWAALTQRSDIPAGARADLSRLLGHIDAMRLAQGESRFSGVLEKFLAELRTDSGPQELQVLKSVRSILEQAEKNRASLRDLRESFETALFSLRPKGKNRVQVYDAVMALPKEYRVVFMPGILENGFPRAIQEDPVFKDAERRVLNGCDPVLEERVWRESGERYFFYMAVTRASEKLYFSYPSRDERGRPTLPSFFLEEVRGCFEALPVARPAERVLTTPEDWETEDEVSQGLAYAFIGRGVQDAALQRRLGPVLSAWENKPSFRAVLLEARPEVRAELRDAKALEIFSKSAHFSATRLETYATCAFKYFCERVLRLRQPLEGLEKLKMGSLLHEALEKFYKDIPEKRLSNPTLWENLETMKKRLLEKLDEALKKSPFRHEPLYRQKMYRVSMADTLSRFAEEEAVFHKRRALVPAYFEYQFGSGGEDALHIPSSDGDILLEGRIDRIDVLSSEKKALVVDYKRSKRPRSVRDKLEQGLELQLPMYLLAVKRVLGLDPIGAELRYLNDSKQDGIYAGSGREALGLHANRKTFSEEELAQVLDSAEDSVRAAVQRLRAGDISVVSKDCDLCRFDPVCRFQKWKLIYSDEAQ